VTDLSYITYLLAHQVVLAVGFERLLLRGTNRALNSELFDAMILTFLQGIWSDRSVIHSKIAT
jgi:hypothetical protein